MPEIASSRGSHSVKGGKKKCCVCGLTHSKSAFGFYRYTTSSGKRSVRINSRCKGCEKRLRQERYARNRDRELALMRKYKEEHRDEINKKARESKRGDPSTLIARRASEAKRRASGYDRNTGEIKKTISAVLSMAKVGGGYLDEYSSKIIQDPTIDHIVPLSSGGTNFQDNLCVTSRFNNSSKHSRPLLRWLVYRCQR